MGLLRWINLNTLWWTRAQGPVPGHSQHTTCSGAALVTATVAGSTNVYTRACRGVDWMRVAVHLFHCVDRVAFLTTVVRRKPGCAERLHHESQGLAMEAIAAVGPLVRPLLIRMFRYLRTCFEIVREKIVSDLAVPPRDARGEARRAEATDGTRAVAYQLAMAHEVCHPLLHLRTPSRSPALQGFPFVLVVLVGVFRVWHLPCGIGLGDRGLVLYAACSPPAVGMNTTIH